MTYYDLMISANRKLDNGEITLGEYEEMIAPLKREIESERKKGKWYWFGRLRTCSNCDKSYGGDGTYYFCPNCGADMREVHDEHK